MDLCDAWCHWSCVRPQSRSDLENFDDGDRQQGATYHEVRSEALSLVCMSHLPPPACIGHVGVTPVPLELDGKNISKPGLSLSV